MCGRTTHIARDCSPEEFRVQPGCNFNRWSGHALSLTPPRPSELPEAPVTVVIRLFILRSMIFLISISVQSPIVRPSTSHIMAEIMGEEKGNIAGPRCHRPTGW